MSLEWLLLWRKFWKHTHPCLPPAPWGPAGPRIDSRSASEPRERRHRSGQKQLPAPGGAQDRSSVGEPWFSGPAGAVALSGRDRGRSQSLAAARLTLSAPSGSESAPRAMRNFGNSGVRAADSSVASRILSSKASPICLHLRRLRTKGAGDERRFSGFLRWQVGRLGPGFYLRGERVGYAADFHQFGFPVGFTFAVFFHHRGGCA